MNPGLNNRPSLRRRMVIQIGLMVLCSLLIGVGAIIGINGLHQDMGVTVQGYRELRQIYEVGFELAVARDALSASQPDDAKALTALETANLRLSPSYDQDSGDAPLNWLDESDRASCRDPITLAISALNSPVPSTALSPINDGLGRLAMLSAKIRTTLDALQKQANRRHHLAMVFIASLSSAFVILAVVIGVLQYRGVVSPLDQLARGVRRFAAGNLSQRIVPDANREFASLADDFNSMAAELESMCRNLEEKVEARSRELTRSQRLASVGYLAAGFAHEINNPLSIITGYSERSLKLLDRDIDQVTLDKTRGTIRIICEEAFRCKEITDRLLTLARPSTENPHPVSLALCAEEVVRNVGGLAAYSDRKISFATPLVEDLNVLANEGEMKQVLINLLLNALEAVELAVGEVEIRICRNDDLVELSVSDNGKGMTPETLGRIFEPFYTEKRGLKPGMGLGLSVTHAIVERYGGTIHAQSDGPGLGSRFIVRLPAAEEGVRV